MPAQAIYAACASLAASAGMALSRQNIAMEVGFSDVSHFNRLFHAQRGKQSSFWRVVTRPTQTD
jgi:transcriptional regulator GlxA family with amidase domain